MRRSTVASLVLCLTVPFGAGAACDSEQQIKLSAEVSTLLGPSVLPVETEESKAINQENMELFMASPTDEVCEKLEALLVRAKAVQK